MSLTERFWRDAAAAPLVVLTDFDATITHQDVGDLIIDTLTPPSPETLRSFAGGKVGSRALWQDSIARINPPQALALAQQVPIDPTFPAFVRFCREQGLPLAVVSDGFGFYIEAILKREGLSDLPVFCNEWVGPGDLAFPNTNPACDFCGCCKALVARRLKALGARIIYAGDGVSDLYAAGFADWVFARARLAAFMAEGGSPYYPLTDFAAVQTELSAHLSSFADGTAERQSTITPNQICRF